MRSLGILSVRKEAKLSASEVHDIGLEQSVIIGAWEKTVPKWHNRVSTTEMYGDFDTRPTFRQWRRGNVTICRFERWRHQLSVSQRCRYSAKNSWLIDFDHKWGFDQCGDPSVRPSVCLSHAPINGAIKGYGYSSRVIGNPMLEV